MTDMFRAISFAIVLLCGSFLILVANNTGSRWVGWIIVASALAGLLWAVRELKNSGSSEKSNSKAPAPGAKLAISRIVSCAAIAVAGVGSMSVAANRESTVTGLIMAVAGVVATLYAIRDYRNRA
jgi:protein-S-isoprenylcysteine O-methyltransferase Ste14